MIFLLKIQTYTHTRYKSHLRSQPSEEAEEQLVIKTGEDKIKGKQQLLGGKGKKKTRKPK